MPYLQLLLPVIYNAHGPIILRYYHYVPTENWYLKDRRSGVLTKVDFWGKARVSKTIPWSDFQNTIPRETFQEEIKSSQLLISAHGSQTIGSDGKPETFPLPSESQRSIYYFRFVGVTGFLVGVFPDSMHALLKPIPGSETFSNLSASINHNVPNHTLSGDYSLNDPRFPNLMHWDDVWLDWWLADVSLGTCTWNLKLLLEARNNESMRASRSDVGNRLFHEDIINTNVVLVAQGYMTLKELLYYLESLYFFYSRYLIFCCRPRPDDRNPPGHNIDQTALRDRRVTDTVFVQQLNARKIGFCETITGIMMEIARLESEPPQHAKTIENLRVRENNTWQALQNLMFEYRGSMRGDVCSRCTAPYSQHIQMNARLKEILAYCNIIQSKNEKFHQLESKLFANRRYGSEMKALIHEISVLKKKIDDIWRFYPKNFEVPLCPICSLPIRLHQNT